MTSGVFCPSMLNRGSYFPGPQELYTAFASAGTAADDAMIAPGLRSWFGHPSSRWPMPGADELSTVEWHRAQVTPTLERWSCPFTGSTVPTMPTTELSLISVSVVA